MKSRITIEVDFSNNNLPVIQILSQDSDDVRDGLIKAFLQSLQHTSRWCKILYEGEASTFDDATVNKQRWRIVPITPKEIKDEVKLMLSVIKNTEPIKLWDEVANLITNDSGVLDSETTHHLNEQFIILRK